jgi:hypothetical protein
MEQRDRLNDRLRVLAVKGALDFDVSKCRLYLFER